MEGLSVQAPMDFGHQSGAYANVWTAAIKEPDFAAEVEIDLTAGYAQNLVEGLGLDLSLTYPGGTFEYGFDGSRILSLPKFRGNPDVWVARSPSVIGRPARDGTFTPGGRNFDNGSFKDSSPRRTMSARIAPVKVFPIEPVSKTLLEVSGGAPAPGSP